MRTTVFATLLFFAINLHAAGEYRNIEVEFLKIVIDTQWISQGAPGYIPVRVEISNLGDDRTIEFAFRGNRWARMSGASVTEVQQNVHLKRGDHVKLTIPVPVMTENENLQFSIRENGRVLDTSNYFGFQSGKMLDESPVVIVANGSSPFSTTAAAWLRPMPTRYRVAIATGGAGVSSRSGPTPTMDVVLDPSRLPDNWLGFTSVRAVLVGPSEWSLLTETQRTALLTWSACGGDLILVDGNLHAIFPDKPPDEATARYFLGHLHFPKMDSVTTAGLDTALERTRLPNQEGWGLPANRTPDWGWIGEGGFRLPIPGVNGIRLRAYMTILVVFTLLIGPANYFFLWRRRRQVLLVLTVPLISVFFIGFLAVYAIAGEGFGVHGRAESFTVLDQQTRQAATRASVSLFAAGMTPSGGLSFSRELAVFPLGTDGRGSAQAQNLVLTDSQRFVSGILRARSPANFEEAVFRTARERLSFSNESDGVSVVNGLGVTIQQLRYRQGGRDYVLTGTLKPGSRGTLKSATGAQPSLSTLKYAPLSPQKFDRVFESQPESSYLAILERSPFWESGISSLDERGSFHLVLGYVAGEP